MGERRFVAARPYLKLTNALTLLLLIYANACAALPEVVAFPDADFLALVLGVVAALCVVAFASGWWLARLLRTDRARQVSLIFALGMNNNGTALVLASVALADRPRVLLPILFYNLLQHLAAGCVTALLGRRGESSEVEDAGPATEGDVAPAAGRPAHAPLGGGR
jgi:BASS family bile acid:Na+ symporter